ncbi:MAG: hypothetical protein ACI9KE_003174 [Polyangiales bacterium]|jgi:hypothetical protein
MSQLSPTAKRADPKKMGTASAGSEPDELNAFCTIAKAPVPIITDAARDKAKAPSPSTPSARWTYAPTGDLVSPHGAAIQSRANRLRPTWVRFEPDGPQRFATCYRIGPMYSLATTTLSM